MSTMPDYYKHANIPFAYNYAGTSIYNSTYEGEMSEYYKRINNGLWIYNQLIGRQEMYNQLSSKYFITYGESNLIPIGYEKIYITESNYQIYENKNFINICLLYTSRKSLNIRVKREKKVNLCGPIKRESTCSSILLL